MRAITLMTKAGLTYEGLHDVVLAAFSNYSVFEDNPKDGDGRIYLTKENAAIDIDFTPNDTMSSFAYEFEEGQLSLLPFDAHLTNASFKTDEDILILAKAIKNKGIEFWVHDEDGSIVSGDAFIKTANNN